MSSEEAMSRFIQKVKGGSLINFKQSIVKVMNFVRQLIRNRNPKLLEGIQAMQKEIRDAISQSKDDKQKLLD